MAGQKSRDVLIKIGDGGAPENFVTLAGIKARTISLSAGLIDATTAESPEALRELMVGAGTKRAEVAGAGVFKDAASDALVRQAYFSGEAGRRHRCG
jgi:TP901-1 family phage major tail protein